jgi:dTDP-4-dehydrorhamnose reductase
MHGTRMSAQDTRLLILGGTGMLGHKLFQRLRGRFPAVKCLARANLDAAPYRDFGLFDGQDAVGGVDFQDFRTLEAVLDRLRPEVVVNCTGVIKQRPEASDPVTAITLNALLPHRLAEVIGRWQGRLVHFSTDCVFSGERGNYTEEDATDATDLYGRTKALGEVLAPNALTLRTSIIGRELVHRSSLLEWFLSNKGRRIRGFRRVIYSGVTTIEMANVLTTVLTERPSLSGLYQVAAEPISKYDLLMLIRDTFDFDVDIVPDDTEVSDRSLRREKLSRDLGYLAAGWPTLIRAIREDPTPYDQWRTQTGTSR